MTQTPIENTMADLHKQFCRTMVTHDEEERTVVALEFWEMLQKQRDEFGALYVFDFASSLARRIKKDGEDPDSPDVTTYQRVLLDLVKVKKIAQEHE